MDIIKELQDFNMQVDVYDPWIDAAEAQQAYAITPLASPEPGSYDAVIIAVAHQQFKQLGAAGIHALGKASHIVYDLKYILDKQEADIRL